MVRRLEQVAPRSFLVVAGARAVFPFERKSVAVPLEDSHPTFRSLRTQVSTGYDRAGP